MGLVVVVVVVGACIAVGGWLATGAGRSQGATAGRRPGVAMRSWVRVRSAMALGCLSTLLGLGLAAAVGAVLVLLFVLLRSSVG